MKSTSPTSSLRPVQFGTAYYPDHWPESEWARDLDRIQAAGLAAVRFGEFSWSWYEPEPGRFDFAALDRFVDLVEERGLELCLCTPTATPPPWMDELFPDGRLMDMHGRRCLSHRHYWCWNHPGARAQAERTITALATRYLGRRCLWGWQIDNEPNYAEQTRDAEGMYDWNPHSRRAFAAWLERRHGTIAALNDAWWTNFWSQRVRTWDEAATPRGKVNPHAWLDFLRWRESALAEQIAWQAALLRRLTPGVRIGCNIPETGVTGSVNIGQDYFAQAAAGLDWVGTDLYQATGDRAADLARHAHSTDLLRSAAEAAGAEFFLSETQAGPHVRAWPNGFAGEGFGPDYLADCARVYAERGATRIWWFLWRPTLGGVELGMNGVQDLAGADTTRTREVQKLAADGAALARRRTAWLRRPRAVVHYSRASLLHRSFFTAELRPLNDLFDGWHTLLEALGYRVDYVTDAQLVAGAAADAALVVAPFSVVLDDATVTALARVKSPLLVGPLTGACDEHGRLRVAGAPAELTARIGVAPGLWRDVGRQPNWPGGKPFDGWRELGAAPAQRRWRAGKFVFAAGRTRDAWFAGDLGAAYWNARLAVRRTLAASLRRLLRAR